MKSENKTCKEEKEEIELLWAGGRSELRQGGYQDHFGKKMVLE
jgi:putative hemolysin